MIDESSKRMGAARFGHRTPRTVPGLPHPNPHGRHTEAHMEPKHGGRIPSDEREESGREPDPAAVMADLRVLESKLSNAFKTESNDPDAMQLRYSVALTAVANFLKGAGIEEKIAHKFI